MAVTHHCSDHADSDYIKTRLSGAGSQRPAEIKRREVSWTLTKKLDTSAGQGEIKRREVVLDPQASPE